MSVETAIAVLEEFLALSAVRDAPPEAILEGFAERAREHGIPLARMMVAWRLFDARYRSQALVWHKDRGLAVERFDRHQATESDDYLKSPIHHILTCEEDVVRRRIDPPDNRGGFPILEELRAQGLTDYVITRVGFGDTWPDLRPGGGVLMSFVSDQPGGFSEAQIAAFGRLRFMVALALRSTMQNDMRETMARTYIARSAAQSLEAGDIVAGNGATIEAVIWYCDLRGSTSLCEALGLQRYLPLLNAYFAAVATPVVAHGGDILDFIGDAVLAVFPHSPEGIAAALEATRAALGGLERFRVEHADLLGGRADTAAVAGIAIDTGTVMSGNIGIAGRLTFSVIGPTVNQVARIERVTKELGEPVLVTREVAASEPDAWVSRGAFELAGVPAPVELFALAPASGATADQASAGP